MIDPNDASASRAALRIGKVLRDKWRIDRLVGIGGMAAVYAATHCNNGKRVAIKLLHPELSMIPEIRTRFLREGYVANKVAHPCIVSVLDDDVTDEGAVFLVMELLDGETVEALRERSGHFLPVHQVVQIADQLLDVLAAAHAVGIVHRDIKPENLFLTRDGGLKVLDFGIARLRELSSAKMTMTGAGAMGTPAFMPPEQARGRSESISPRSDVWSVGATMFALASGRLVHDAETVNELLLAAMTQPAPLFLSVLPRFPPGVAAVIDRALAFEQENRWADARAMQVALRNASQALGIVLQDRTSISGLFPSSMFGLSAALSAGAGALGPTGSSFVPGPPQSSPVSSSSPARSPAWPEPASAASWATNPTLPPPGQGAPAQPPSAPGSAPGALLAPPLSPRSFAAPPPSSPQSSSLETTRVPIAVNPMMTAPTAIHATAPGLTMASGPRMAPGKSRAKLFAALGGAAALVVGLGVWAALLRSPPAPAKLTDEPRVAASTGASKPPDLGGVLPGETAAPLVTATPVATAEPAPVESASAAPIVTASPATTKDATPPGVKGTPAPPLPSSAPSAKKKTERDLLNRRN
jgi:eukaryotic-like serine/threonine-protein kinase